MFYSTSCAMKLVKRHTAHLWYDRCRITRRSRSIAARCGVSCIDQVRYSSSVDILLAGSEGKTLLLYFSDITSILLLCVGIMAHSHRKWSSTTPEKRFDQSSISGQVIFETDVPTDGTPGGISRARGHLLPALYHTILVERQVKCLYASTKYSCTCEENRYDL